MGLKFHNVIADNQYSVVVYRDSHRVGQLTFDEAGFKEWQGVVDGSWSLRELLALRTARRVLSEIAAHAKLGDDSYHDAVIDTARAWMELYR